jgi:hypothetical protein
LLKLQRLWVSNEEYRIIVKVAVTYIKTLFKSTENDKPFRRQSLRVCVNYKGNSIATLIYSVAWWQSWESEARDHQGQLTVHGITTPKMIFRRGVVRSGMWAACICFRIRYSCELTGKQIWNFRFHNRPVILLLHWPIISFSRRTFLHGVGHVTVEALSQYEMEAGIPSF